MALATIIPSSVLAAGSTSYRKVSEDNFGSALSISETLWISVAYRGLPSVKPVNAMTGLDADLDPNASSKVTTMSSLSLTPSSDIP